MMQAVVSSKVVRQQMNPLIEALDRHGYCEASEMVKIAVGEILNREEWADVATGTEDMASRLLDVRDGAAAVRDCLHCVGRR
jgi:hypothetical protein